MEHVADNEVPDYITELAEAELLAAQEANPFNDDEVLDFSEETVDDSDKFIEELEAERVANFDDDEEVDIFGDTDDTEDDDI